MPFCGKGKKFLFIVGRDGRQEEDDKQQEMIEMKRSGKKIAADQSKNNYYLIPGNVDSCGDKGGSGNDNCLIVVNTMVVMIDIVGEDITVTVTV